MAIFTMLIGIPAAGKSSYSKNFPNSVVISTDSIREIYFNDVNDQSHNTEVFDIALKKANENLRNGHDVIFDATNLRRKRRMGFLKSLPNNITKKAIMVITPFEMCLERNRLRERHIPEKVMWNMLKNFEPASKFEGFDEVIIFDTMSSDIRENLTETINNEIKELCIITHDNPHHSLTIGEHCKAATEHITEFTKNLSIQDKSILYCAALLHDIGKKETKVFTNAKGEPSVIAHFYNHENVGAYKSLVYTVNSFTINERIEIANLISFHLIFFMGEKVIEKRKQFFDNDFWLKLTILHKADLAAH